MVCASISDSKTQSSNFLTIDINTRCTWPNIAAQFMISQQLNNHLLNSSD